jgi:hypothetical protein
MLLLCNYNWWLRDDHNRAAGGGEEPDLWALKNLEKFTFHQFA